MNIFVKTCKKIVNAETQKRNRKFKANVNNRFFNGNQNSCQTKTLFVELICNKLRCCLKFENNEIFSISNDNTLTLL